MTRRAVIYIRTSTEAQADRQGPKVQEDKCRAYAKTHGLEVVAVLRESVTGRTDERPKFADALVLIEEGDADAVLFASLDRLARTLTVQEGLLARAWEAGAEVHAADVGVILKDDPDDPARTFIRQVMGAAAQMDRSMLVARMRAGRRRKKLDGGKAEGRYAFGYSKHGPIEREQHVLALIRSLITDQGLTFEAASARLNARGAEWYPRTGRPWTRSNLAAVCRTAGITRSASEAA